MAIQGVPIRLAGELELLYCLTGEHGEYSEDIVGAAKPPNKLLKGPHLRFSFLEKDKHLAIHRTLKIWGIPFNFYKTKEPKYITTLDEKGISSLSQLFVNRYNQPLEVDRNGASQFVQGSLGATSKIFLFELLTGKVNPVDDILQRLQDRQEAGQLNLIGKDYTKIHLQSIMDDFIRSFVQSNLKEGLWPKAAFSESSSPSDANEKSPSQEEFQVDALKKQPLEMYLKCLTGIEFKKTTGSIKKDPFASASAEDGVVRGEHLRALFAMTPEGDSERIACLQTLQVFGIRYHNEFMKKIDKVNHCIITIEYADCVGLQQLFHDSLEQVQRQWQPNFEVFLTAFSPTFLFNLFFSDGAGKLIETIQAKLPKDAHFSDRPVNLQFALDEFIKRYLAQHLPRDLWPTFRPVTAWQELPTSLSLPLSPPITYQYVTPPTVKASETTTSPTTPVNEKERKATFKSH